MHDSIMNVLGTKQAATNALCKNPGVLHPPQMATKTDYCSEESGPDDHEILSETKQWFGPQLQFL